MPLLPLAPEDSAFRILLCVADEKLAERVSGFLAKAGFDVRLATNGEIALQAVATIEPHLVLAPFLAEEIDGLQLTKTLRETTEIPVLLMGNGSDENEIAALQAGADDFLAQPLKPPVLLARLVAHLRRAYRYGLPSEEEVDIETPFWAEDGEDFVAPVEEVEDEGEKPLPRDWARCDACDYQGPRVSFETEDFFGNPKAQCPRCESTEHIVFSLNL